MSRVMVGVQGRDVRAGDYIQADGTWVRVVSVEPAVCTITMDGGRRVEVPGRRITTALWVTYKTDTEGVGVQREV